MKSLNAAILLLAICGTSVCAAEWFAAPNGKKDNPGTKKSPWTIDAALGKPKKVGPGDTIWLRGGEYTGSKAVNVGLKGTEKAPITVRNYANERVTIRRSVDFGKAYPDTEYVWLWGLEVAHRPKGNTKLGPAGVSISASASKRRKVTLTNLGIRLINCMIHDNPGNGIGYWGGAGDSEVHGCLVYNNGVDAGPRGRAHGFYIQNRDRPKLVKNNIVFRNFFSGIQTGSTGVANRHNITWEGNTIFNNGELSKKSGMVMNLWSYGNQPNKGLRIIENCTYAPYRALRCGFEIGKSEGALIKDNYFCAPRANRKDGIGLRDGNVGLRLEGNTFYGRVAAAAGALDGNTKIMHFDPNRFGSGNTKLTKRPVGAKVFVRPNDYEKGRANITVYNWDKKNTVAVDVSKAGLKNGDAYAVYDAQNFFAKPVAKGTYDGKTISVPMTGLKVAVPYNLPAGYKTPPHTAPEFAVFVIRKAGK